MPLVSPLPGEDMATLAQTLLRLADDPRTEVAYVPGDNLFTVSDLVADRYLAELGTDEQEPKPRAAKKATAKKTTAKKEG